MPWQPWTKRPAVGAAVHELVSDPARSDELIASEAHCSRSTVASARARLESIGLVQHVPPASRARVPYPQQPSAARAAVLTLGPDASPRDVARLAGVSLQAAWAMLRKLGPASLRDCAAASDSLSVRAAAACERCGAPFTFTPRGNRPPRRWCGPDCRRPIRQPGTRHPPKIPDFPPAPDFAKGECTRVPAAQAAWWTSSRPELRTAAAEICQVCPILLPCASWAVTALPVSDTAVYGGMSATERQRLKRLAAEGRPSPRNLR